MDDLEKIQAQILELQRKADDLVHQKKAEVIADLKAKIKAYGLTFKDIGLPEKYPNRNTQTVAVKYRLGEFTWTGRGRKPKFVEDYLAGGGTLEELLV